MAHIADSNNHYGLLDDVSYLDFTFGSAVTDPGFGNNLPSSSNSFSR